MWFIIIELTYFQWVYKCTSVDYATVEIRFVKLRRVVESWSYLIHKSIIIPEFYKQLMLG
jgi:hypothetical protein